MRILFDHSTPKPLALHLPGHEIVLARKKGWDALPDGHLLESGADAHFDAFITADQNLPYQQSISDLPFSIIILGNPNWHIVQRYVRRIASAVKTTPSGTAFYIDMPKRHDR